MQREACARQSKEVGAATGGCDAPRYYTPGGRSPLSLQEATSWPRLVAAAADFTRTYLPASNLLPREGCGVIIQQLTISDATRAFWTLRQGLAPTFRIQTERR